MLPFKTGTKSGLLSNHRKARRLMQQQVPATPSYHRKALIYGEENMAAATDTSVSLWQLFRLFLQTGATSWGGYMALISVVQKQVSERRHLVSDEAIVKAVSLASVLPGPIAVNVVAYIGFQLKGLKGALVSMMAVLLPCFVMMLVLSHLYLTYGSRPSLAGFFAGITPAVAAILFSTSYNIGRQKIKRASQGVIAMLSLLAVSFLHFALTTLCVIIISGMAGYFLYFKKGKNITFQNVVSLPKRSVNRHYRIAIPVAVILLLVNLPTATDSSWHLYKQVLATFSGLSLSQFGGAYVVVPSMQKILTDHLHWLSQQQFTDAIAMGQITPGPIYISAAFAGYKLLGVGGAIAATIAMFLPSALLMIFASLFLARIEKSPVTIAVFQGIGAAISGMIAASGMLLLCNTTLPYLPMFLLLGICLFAMVHYKVSPIVLIPLSGIAGLFLF